MTVSGTQGEPSPALPAALRSHVENERFEIVTSMRGLPSGVRDGLKKLIDTWTLDFADPGEPFQVTDVTAGERLPIRRLVMAGCSIDHCLVYYERGGGAHTWHVALFHWTPAATRFDGGGLAPPGLASVGAVRAAILSGAVKAPNSLW